MMAVLITTWWAATCNREGTPNAESRGTLGVDMGRSRAFFRDLVYIVSNFLIWPHKDITGAK